MPGGGRAWKATKHEDYHSPAWSTALVAALAEEISRAHSLPEAATKHDSRLCHFVPALQAGFFAYHWVDDQINHVATVGFGPANPEVPLRQAISTVLGPTTINENKFTGWKHNLLVLGLLFDTRESTVSIPSYKVGETRTMIISALSVPSLSRTKFDSLVRTLRHMAMCIRLVCAFAQRLHQTDTSVHPPRTGSLVNGDAKRPPMVADRPKPPQLNGVLLQHFNDLPPLDFTVDIDASDVRPCAIDTTHHPLICHEFTTREQKLVNAVPGAESSGFGRCLQVYIINFC